MYGRDGMASASIGPWQEAAAAKVGYNEGIKPQAELPAMMNRLQGRLSELDGMLSALSERLQPIMRSEPPQNQASPAPQPVANTETGAQLQKLGDYAGSACERVGYMLRLLEV